MNRRQRANPGRPQGSVYYNEAAPPLQPSPRPPPPPATSSKPYNIIPIHDLLVDHPSHRSSEVRAATSALRDVADLRKPPFYPWLDGVHDLLDWLGLFFGLQANNVRNQREHIVLHLANSHMRSNGYSLSWSSRSTDYRKLQFPPAFVALKSFVVACGVSLGTLAGQAFKSVSESWMQRWSS